MSQWRLLNVSKSVLNNFKYRYTAYHYISRDVERSRSSSARACFKRKIVGGQRCCPIDDCGRPKAAWGSVREGAPKPPPSKEVQWYNSGKCLKFYYAKSCILAHFWWCIQNTIDSWINIAEINRPTIRLPTCWHSPVWVIRPFSNTKYVRSTLGLLLLTDRATTSAPTIRRSNVYVWSVNKNI